MNRSELIAYYKKWGGNVLQFTDMLSRKAMFTACHGCTVNINGVMRNAAEAEQIFCLADDLACEGLLK